VENEIEPRKAELDAEAEPVNVGEGNMSIIAKRDDAALPWSKVILRRKSFYRNLGGLAIGHITALVRIGKTMSRSR
jgi:hypothetical protein